MTFVRLIWIRWARVGGDRSRWREREREKEGKLLRGFSGRNQWMRPILVCSRGSGGGEGRSPCRRDQTEAASLHPAVGQTASSHSLYLFPGPLTVVSNVRTFFSSSSFFFELWPDLLYLTGFLLLNCASSETLADLPACLHLYSPPSPSPGLGPWEGQGQKSPSVSSPRSARADRRTIRGLSTGREINKLWRARGDCVRVRLQPRADNKRVVTAAAALGSYQGATCRNGRGLCTDPCILSTGIRGLWLGYIREL